MATRKKKIVVKIDQSEKDKAKSRRKVQRKVHGVFHKPTTAITPKKGKGSYSRAKTKRKLKKEA